MRLDVNQLQTLTTESVTTAQSVEKQGEAYLQMSQTDEPAVVHSLCGWSWNEALSEVLAQLQQQHQQSLASAANEQPVQQFLAAAVPALLALAPNLERSAHDTHAAGVSTAGGSGQLKPDLCICHGHHALGPSIDTVIEAKPAFSPAGPYSACFQIVQRAQQLQSWQPWRAAFLLASLCHNQIILWRLLFAEGKVMQHMYLLVLCSRLQIHKR